MEPRQNTHSRMVVKKVQKPKSAKWSYVNSQSQPSTVWDISRRVQAYGKGWPYPGTRTQENNSGHSLYALSLRCFIPHDEHASHAIARRTYMNYAGFMA